MCSKDKENQNNFRLEKRNQITVDRDKTKRRTNKVLMQGGTCERVEEGTRGRDSKAMEQENGVKRQENGDK